MMIKTTLLLNALKVESLNKLLKRKNCPTDI